MPLLARTVIFTAIGFGAAFAFLMVLAPWWNFRFISSGGEEMLYSNTILWAVALIGARKFFEFVKSNTGGPDTIDNPPYLAVTFFTLGIGLVMPFAPVFLADASGDKGAFDQALITALFYGLPPILIFSVLSNTPYFLALVREDPRYRRWFAFGRGGNAMWASVASFKALESFFKKGEKGYINGIFLGRALYEDDLAKRFISLTDETHHITIAQSGAGKSISAIWPNLAFYKGPRVVLDPKGEHANFTTETLGMGCVVFDPYGNSRSRVPTSFNPLDEVEIESDHARGFIQAISDGCVIPEERDAHFTEAARTVIEGLIAHVLSTYPDKDKHLPFVADLLKGFDPDLGAADPHALDNIIADMTTNSAVGGLPMEAASILMRAGDRERGAILTTCFRSLKWVNDVPMRKTLTSSTSGFRLSQITQTDQSHSLFIVLPFDYMEEARQIRWMRVLINLINVDLFRNPRSSSQPKLLMILDEFKQLGYMRMLEEGIVTARGAGAKYWILLQDIGQLKANYKASWQTFLGASNVQVFGAGNDPDTTKWTAEALGGLHESGSGNYPLMRPDEVKQFLGKEDPTQIIIRSTGAPMKLQRMAFKDVGKFKGLGLDKTNS